MSNEKQITALCLGGHLDGAFREIGEKDREYKDSIGIYCRRDLRVDGVIVATLLVASQVSTKRQVYALLNLYHHYKSMKAI